MPSRLLRIALMLLGIGVVLGFGAHLTRTAPLETGQQVDAPTRERLEAEVTDDWSRCLDHPMQRLGIVRRHARLLTQEEVTARATHQGDATDHVQDAEMMAEVTGYSLFRLPKVRLLMTFDARRLAWTRCEVLREGFYAPARGPAEPEGAQPNMGQ